MATRVLGVIATAAGEFDRAETLAERARSLYRASDNAIGVQMVILRSGGLALCRRDDVRAKAKLEESLTLAQQLGSAQRAANVTAELGILALYESRYEDAAPLFADALDTGLQNGLRTLIAVSLRGLAVTMLPAGDVVSAARALAAAETFDAHTGSELEPYEESAFAEATETVRARIGERDVAAAWASGSAMSEADAALWARATVAARPPLARRS